MSIDGTIFTHVENVVTFSTSDITNFTEKFTLSQVFKMMRDTGTFWNVFSVLFTDGTVTIDVTFFTSIWTWWTGFFSFNVVGINWTNTMFTNSITVTGSTGFSMINTSFTFVITRSTFGKIVFIISINTVASAWTIS